MLTPYAPFNLGYKVFRQPQVIEGLLEGLGGVLRLTAVACKALVRCAITAATGFRVVFGDSCAWGHGVLLCSVGSLWGEICPSARDTSPSRLCERCHCCVTRSQDFWLFSVSHMRYTYARAALPIPTPSSARRIGMGGLAMTFEEILDQAIAMLQRRGRLTYGALKRQFQLDDAYLEDLKAELIEGQRLAVDEEGRVLVWIGAEVSAPDPTAPPVRSQDRLPLAYTPPYLAEKILTSKSTLEGERKQVTVLFADLKGSMELLADRDPEEARRLLDPVLERMMAAVHRYEGTVNQVMGDGIMALFGAPIAHEDHTVRACYAALAMQGAIRTYAEEVRRTHGVTVQIRVGLNSGRWWSGDWQ